MSKKNSDPLRMCAGCRQLKPRSELYRIALTGSGAAVDESCKLGGRGVYVCRSAACITKIKRVRKSRTAGRGCIPDAVYGLLEDMAEHEGK